MKRKRIVSKENTGNSIADMETIKRCCGDCDGEGVIFNDFDESIECPRCNGIGFHYDTI